MKHVTAEIHPMDCLREGWLLVRDQYWLMVGVAVVGLVVGSLAPLGLLLGPMVVSRHVGTTNASRSGEFRRYRGAASAAAAPASTSGRSFNSATSGQ